MLKKIYLHFMLFKLIYYKISSFFLKEFPQANLVSILNSKLFIFMMSYPTDINNIKCFMIILFKIHISKVRNLSLSRYSSLTHQADQLQQKTSFEESSSSALFWLSLAMPDYTLSIYYNLNIFWHFDSFCCFKLSFQNYTPIYKKKKNKRKKLSPNCGIPSMMAECGCICNTILALFKEDKTLQHVLSCFGCKTWWFYLIAKKFVE